MSAAGLTELHDRYIAAWAARDPEAIVDLHADDTRFWLHHGRAPVDGRPAVRAAFEAMFQGLPDLGFVIHRTEFGPRHWVLDWTLTAIRDDHPVHFDCIDLVTVTDDWRVARKDTFVDGAQFMRALGA